MSKKGGSNSQPAPPDPVKTAQAQTATNIETAIAQSQLNNVNQVTPYGNLTYEQTGTGQNGVPIYTATQTLSPEQQAILDQSQAAELGLATTANNQIASVGETLSDPFSYQTGEHEAWASGLYDNLNSDSINRQREDVSSRLINQGLAPGSEAYDRAMQNVYEAENSSRDRFMLESYQTGMGQAQNERNQSINELSVLLNGGQVTQPNFVNTTPTNIPTVDYAGLVNQNYSNQLANYNQQQADQQNLIGGLFGLAGSGITAFSDKRVKRDIKKVGELDGHPLYRYKYKGALDDGREHVGVMAQETERSRPDAVTEVGGVKAVDYGALFGAAA